MSQVGVLLASSGEKPGRDAAATMQRTASHSKDPGSPKGNSALLRNPALPETKEDDQRIQILRKDD